MFVDRIDAAQRLAKALAPYRGQNPLVHATPEEVAEQVKQGLAKWGPLVKASGIKLN